MLIRKPLFLYSFSISLVLTVFFGAVAILLGPIDWFFFQHYKDRGRLGPVGAWVKTNWCRSILLVHFIRIVIRGPGASTLKEARGSVIISNHQSALDIPVQMLVLPKDSSFVAKQELLMIPIFGYSAAVVGTIFVNRSKGAKNSSLMRAARLLSQGRNLVFYPEGTRSSDGSLRSFKRGAFVMAIEAQASIVPITIMDSRFLCPKGRMAVTSGTIHIWVDQSVSTKGMSQDERYSLADRFQRQIAQNMKELNPQTRPDLWA